MTNRDIVLTFAFFLLGVMAEYQRQGYYEKR